MFRLQPQGSSTSCCRTLSKKIRKNRRKKPKSRVSLTNFVSKIAMPGLKHPHPLHSVEHVDVVVVAGVESYSLRMDPSHCGSLDGSHLYCCNAGEWISQPAQMWSKELAPFLNMVAWNLDGCSCLKCY